MSRVDADSFLHVFFAAPNPLVYDDMLSKPAMRAELEPWLETAYDPSLPLLLPRPEPRGGGVIWYAMASNARQERELRELLRAFFGPSHSDFAGQRAVLDAADPVENAVLLFRGDHCFRLRVEQRQREPFRQAATRLRRLLARRPARRGRATRPLSELVDDLDLALAGGDEPTARQALAALEQDGRLNRRNKAFLKIRFLDRFQLSMQVVDLLQREDLLSGPCPVDVVRMSLEALYATFLESFEKADDPEGAVERCRSYVLPRFGRLFRSTPRRSSSRAFKALMLGAVAEGRAQRAKRWLDSEIFPRAARPYCETLFGLLALPEPVPAEHDLAPYDRARAAFYDGDNGLALERMAAVEPSVDALRLMTEIAYEDQSLSALTAGLAFRERCSEEVVAEAFGLGRYRKMWSAVLECHDAAAAAAGGPRPSTSWSEWLRRLAEDGPWPGLEAEAQAGGEEWPIDLEEAGTIADLLLDIVSSDSSRVHLLDALPHVLAGLRGPNVPTPGRREVYPYLLLGISEEEAIGRYLLVVHDLVMDCMDAGLPPRQYVEIMGTMGEVWARARASRHLDWALDLLDDLVACESPDRGSLVAFLQRVGAFLIEQPRRVEASQWEMFKLLAEDLDSDAYAESVLQKRPAPAAGEAEERGGGFGWMAGKRFTVYTLARNAAERARRILKSKVENLVFDISHAQGGNSRLKALARNADFFLVVASSATHAATDFISANLAAGKEPIYVSGKGSSSILRRLRELGRELD